MPRRRAINDSAERRTRRKVYFFRLHQGIAEDQSFDSYDIERALEIVTVLGFDTGDRYVDNGDESFTSIWPDGRVSSQLRARLGTIRRSALPSIELSGRLSDLSIPEEAGLVEITHCSIFDDGVVGVLFNQFGPRHGRLVSYLNAKCRHELPLASLDGLLRADVAAQLQRFDSVNLVDLSVFHDSIDVIRQHDDGIASALEAARRLTGARKVRLSLLSDPNQNGVAVSRTKGLVERMLSIPGFSSLFSRFQVRGHDAILNKSVELDLLKELLVSSQEVVLHGRRSRSLDDGSAYDAIARAYTQLRPELERATVLLTNQFET